MTNNIAVIILSYNNVDDTLACIQSIAASNAEGLIHIYAVDNGSRPEIVQQLQKEIQKFSTVTLILSEKNLGFAAGMNIGIRKALAGGADYVLILNNDTILNENTILELVKGFALKANVAITVPKILYYDDQSTLWYAGSKKALPYSKHRGLGQKDKGQFDEVEEIDFATGCAMLIKAGVLKEIGLLDERYFFGMEDREFSIRCLREGYTILYIPTSVVYHKVGLTRNRDVHFDRIYLGYLSQLFYIRTTMGKLKWISWFIFYGFYLTFLLPLRIIIINGFSGWLSKSKAALLAWSKAWRAKRAWPLE